MMGVSPDNNREQEARRPSRRDSTEIPLGTLPVLVDGLPQGREPRVLGREIVGPR